LHGDRLKAVASIDICPIRSITARAISAGAQCWRNHARRSVALARLPALRFQRRHDRIGCASAIAGEAGFKGDAHFLALVLPKRVRYIARHIRVL